MADSLEDIVPVINDDLAIRIISLWRKVQDTGAIAKMFSMPNSRIEAKVGLLLALGLIRPDGTISDNAKSLALATATRALSKPGGRK